MSGQIVELAGQLAGESSYAYREAISRHFVPTFSSAEAM